MVEELKNKEFGGSGFPPELEQIMVATAHECFDKTGEDILVVFNRSLGVMRFYSVLDPKWQPMTPCVLEIYNERKSGCPKGAFVLLVMIIEHLPPAELEVVGVMSNVVKKVMN